MGNAFSSVNSRVAMSSKGSAAAVLSEKDAWEFAMAWRDQLQGCVRLEKDPARGDFHLVDTFEWVVFVLNGKLSDGLQEVARPVETTACARAASIVWFALSCCKGYSAKENPCFWRRVFTDLATPVYPKDEIVLITNNAYRTQTVITDAVRFFDSREDGFPRVMLVPKRDYESQCVDVFLNRVSAANPSRERQLEGILAKLKPFIAQRRWNRTLDVSIDEMPVSWLGSVVSKPKRDADEKPVSHADVRLELVSVFVTASEFRDLNVESRLKLMRAGCEIIVRPCAFDRLLVGGNLPDYILPQTLPPPTTESRLRFPRIKLTEALGSASRETGMLCSALPVLQTLTAIQATSQKSPWIGSRVGTREADWAWLGYAIFHPDAESQSAFTALDIDFYGVFEDEVEKLAAMAKGNNLLYAISNDETERSSAYHQAQVQEKTQVRAQDCDRSPAIYQFTSVSWVDICVSTADAIPTGGYVRAVIPGIGLGWIHSQDILQTRSRPPGKPCLRSLRVSIRLLLDDIDEFHLLLAAIGENLTYLEIHDHGPLESSDLHEILRRVPSIKCLRIPHDGSYWTSSSAQIHSPPIQHLEELELGIDTMDFDATVQVPQSLYLPGLKALRIKTRVPDILASSQDALLSILESHKGIEYFEWRGAAHRRDSWWPVAYDKRCGRTLAFRETLVKGVHDTCHGPLPLECRLAFVSVVQSTVTKDEPTALRLFDRDIVRHIIGFATRSSARELWITD